MNFFEAISLWWNGQKLEEFTMYGWPMLYWARLGKYLQFLGGAVVLLDLIGPDRFRRSALRLRVWSRWLAKFPLVRIVLLFIALLSLAATMVPVVVVELHGDRTLSETFGSAGIPIMLGMVLTAGLTYLLIQVEKFLLFVSKVVAFGQHGSGWKWLSFVLIVIGFHLDLLGS
ncbi:hypothetical protein AB0L88_33455 [Saccharopolyspora shandongensis]|uniref:hypothetical protein n=1 Tax=Saccharopolyspora shandongensis TaxID=418495 RepID=UPI0034459E29